MITATMRNVNRFRRLAKPFAAGVLALLLTFAVATASLAHTSHSEEYWSIGSCSLWGGEGFSSDNTASATVWDSNGNCGTVSVRMWYWISGSTKGLTSWTSGPDAAQVLRDNVHDGEKGEYKGGGGTRSLWH